MSALLTPVRLAAFATAFAFLVIVFGAFVRLSNAGLSCPDWPTCYGKVTWPGHAAEIAKADAAFPDRPVETHKAWREQVHRMIAGTLGGLVFALALIAAWRRRIAVILLIAAALAAAFGIALYIRHDFVTSALLSAVAIALPLLVAVRLDRDIAWRVAVAAFAVVIFQAMLGMWTVTLLLKPVVVMGHLLGGMATFGLLGFVTCRLQARTPPSPAQSRLRPMIVVALLLIALQIALGGWTSANYAALACGMEYPTCAGRWWPQTDFREAFVLWRGIGVNYEGGVLDAAARAAIQVTHRIGAIVVFGHVLATALLAWRRRWRAHASIIIALLLAQIAFGIGNVVLALPLPVATLHNATAALLLFAVIALLVRTLRPMPGAAVTRVRSSAA